MKNKNTIISTIFSIIFILIFSYYNLEEYRDFYLEKELIQKQEIELKNNLKKFSLDNLEKLEESKLYYTPNKNLINIITQKINKAEKRIYLETYIFTEKRIRESLKKAKNRGIDVKVVMEKNPYKAPYLNNKTYEYLIKNNIETSWSNTKNFSLNHSKFIIIDDLVIISTGNISYSTFTKNRDFFVFIKDKKILKVVENIFLSDFNGKSYKYYNKNIVLSPSYSRNKIEELIKNAKNDIKMHFQYLYDEKINNLLIEKAKNNIKIEIILRADSYKNNIKEIESLKNNNIKIKFLKKPINHSKAILIDSKYLFIGSINMSEYSLDKNRELGIIILNKNLIEKYKQIHKKDFE